MPEAGNHATSVAAGADDSVAADCAAGETKKYLVKLGAEGNRDRDQLAIHLVPGDAIATLERTAEAARAKRAVAGSKVRGGNGDAGRKWIPKDEAGIGDYGRFVRGERSGAAPHRRARLSRVR